MTQQHRKGSPLSYTEEQRLKCVALLTSNGGLTYEGIIACQEYCHKAGLPIVSKATLARWLGERKEKVQPMAIEIIQNDPAATQANLTISDKMARAYNNLLDQLSDPEFIKNNKNLLHAATSFGILEERRRISIGLTMEIIDLCKRFVAVVTRKGFDPVRVFEDMIESFEAEPDVRATSAEEIVVEATTPHDFRRRKR